MTNTNKDALKVLFISNAIFVFADRLLGPLYAIFTEKFDANVLSISFSWFIFMISATVCTVIVNKYGDKVKEKEYLLVAGFLIRVLSWILYIFTTNLLMFFAIQIILGIGEAIGSPAFDAIFAKHLKKGAEIGEYSSWKILQNFALAIGSLVGGIVVFYLNFNVLFILMAILGIISSVIVLMQRRELL
jgi:MFS family permease